MVDVPVSEHDPIHLVHVVAEDLDRAGDERPIRREASVYQGETLDILDENRVARSAERDTRGSLA